MLMSQYYYAQQPLYPYEHHEKSEILFEQREAGEISSTDNEPQVRKAANIRQDGNIVQRTAVEAGKQMIEAGEDIASWREERRKRYPTGLPVKADAASSNPATSMQAAYKPKQSKTTTRYKKKAKFQSTREESAREKPFRTKVCPYYFARGTCKYDDRCTFLHQRQPKIPFAKLDSLHQRRVKEMNTLLATPTRMLSMLNALRLLASTAAV